MGTGAEMTDRLIRGVPDDETRRIADIRLGLDRSIVVVGDLGDVREESVSRVGDEPVPFVGPDLRLVDRWGAVARIVGFEQVDHVVGRDRRVGEPA